MNHGQSRVIDPVLTTHVRGYKNASRVGSFLFPSVDVGVSAGKVIEFGKEAFQMYNARRSPGAATKRIDFGYEGKPYSLVQDSLEGKIPREYARDAAAVPQIDLGIRATNTVMNSLTLTLEYDQARLATDEANYGVNNKETLVGVNQWSHPDSRPVSAIEGGRQRIRTACGIYPNVLVCGPRAYSALKTNVEVTGRFRNVDIVTSAMLAALFELDAVVEGKATYASDNGAFHDVWGNFAVLAYAPTSPNGQEEPSFGYTYTMAGHPYVEQPYFENGVKSWIYGVTYERQPLIAGMDAGYLFTDVSADDEE